MHRQHLDEATLPELLESAHAGQTNVFVISQSGIVPEIRGEP